MRDRQDGRKANKTCVPCRERKVRCDAAVTGLPCSGCSSRKCVGLCALPVRKVRARKVNTPATPSDEHVTHRAERLSTPNQIFRQTQHETRPDLFYLDILREAAKESSEVSHSQNAHTIRGSTKLDHLDDVDYQYLVNKGVLDLPPPECLDIFIKSYFDHVHPFVPILNKADFMRDYWDGNCSSFLLRAMLAPAALRAPIDVLFPCRFASRSEAQEAFFTKAKLLHDFSAEGDSLAMLQGSIILCMIILERPTDRDYSYWLHNAIRLASKLDLQHKCTSDAIPNSVSAPYQKAWWALYAAKSLDTFHVFADTRRLRLLTDSATITIRPRIEQDLGEAYASQGTSDLLSPATSQQTASAIAHRKVSRIAAQCLDAVKNRPQQDPSQLLLDFDIWRKSLASDMHVNDPRTDVYYLNVLALSHRYECILCRLLLRYYEKSQQTKWVGRTKERLRSSILELDTISMAVLANGILGKFPISFVTTMCALLALHIESALGQNAAGSIRSAARIRISEIMLLLNQHKDIPVLKRALPVFEEVIAKDHLCMVPASDSNDALSHLQSQRGSMRDDETASHSQVGQWSMQDGNEQNALFDVDFLGFNFLDDWPDLEPGTGAAY